MILNPDTHAGLSFNGRCSFRRSSSSACPSLGRHTTEALCQTLTRSAKLAPSFRWDVITVSFSLLPISDHHFQQIGTLPVYHYLLEISKTSLKSQLSINRTQWEDPTHKYSLWWVHTQKKTSQTILAYLPFSLYSVSPFSIVVIQGNMDALCPLKIYYLCHFLSAQWELEFFLWPHWPQICCIYFQTWKVLEIISSHGAVVGLNREHASMLGSQREQNSIAGLFTDSNGPFLGSFPPLSTD